jgi:hypothetical protein
LLLLLLLGALCAGVIAWVAHLRARSHSPAELLARLPARDAVVLCIDFAALRQAGLLRIFEGSDLVQEPEYRAFRDGTGFDYLRDLDWLAASFQPESSYFLLRGRFNWAMLADYVALQGGTCYNSFCRVQGSTPDRRISHYPMEPGLMALAVSKDDYAASALQRPSSSARPAARPPQPVWFSVPAARLRQIQAVPAAARLLAQALADTEGVLLAAGPRDGQVELSLEATCGAPQQAAALASQLRRLTALLIEAVAAEKRQPDSRDLSGILAAGAFESKGRVVYGRWPVPRAFLQSLAGGTR